MTILNKLQEHEILVGFYITSVHSFPGICECIYLHEERRKLKELARAGEVASPRSLSPSLKSKLQAGSVYLGQGSGRSMICKVDLLLPCLPWQPLRAAHWLPPQMSTVWTHTHTHIHIYIYTFMHTPRASTSSKFLVSLESFWVCEVLPNVGTWCFHSLHVPYIYTSSHPSPPFPYPVICHRAGVLHRTPGDLPSCGVEFQF